MAREHIARYNALQQQMAAERQKAKANRFILMAIGIGILALLFFVIMVIVSVKNRAINRRNRLLARKIADAVYYKKKYLEEMRLQEPPTAPEIETATDEQLFHYIHEVIVRERLFLDPKFERQTIMDRFQLSKERVGAIFAKGSQYAKLTDYTQELRLEYSTMLLTNNPDKSISQVADESGFGSYSYYCKCFRQRFGMTPSEFRMSSI
jgi:AraC-like DNA-binding protein